MPEYLKLYWQILAYFLLFSGIYLSFQVYFSNPKSKANRYFIAFTFSAITWGSVPYFLIFNFSPFLNLFFLKIAYATAVLTAVLGYFLLQNLSISDLKKNFYLAASTVFLGLLLFAFAWSPLLVKSFKFTEQYGITPIFNRTGEIFYFGILTYFVFLIIHQVYKKYLYSLKNNLKEAHVYFYFLIGFSLTNLISGLFNVILPRLLNKPDAAFWPVGNFSIIFMIFATGFGILRQKIFSTKPIITEFFTVFMIMLNLMQFSIIEKKSLKIISLIIIAITSILGYSLVKLTRREAKMREILEDMVRERTKELELSKKELEKKVQELEKWYKLTIGRELRMVELKQKIKEKEEEIKKITEVKP